MKATRDVPRLDYGLQDRILVPNVMDDGFDFFMTSQGKKENYLSYCMMCSFFTNCYPLTF